jgi:hypothetical protein
MVHERDPEDLAGDAHLVRWAHLKTHGESFMEVLGLWAELVVVVELLEAETFAELVLVVALARHVGHVRFSVALVNVAAGVGQGEPRFTLITGSLQAKGA